MVLKHVLKHSLLRLLQIFSVVSAKLFILPTKLLFKNSDSHDVQFYGSDNFLLLILKNLLRPQRFLKRLRYGQVIRLPNTLLYSSPLIDCPASPEILAAVEELRSSGCVIFPGLYCKQAETLVATYGLEPDNYQAASSSYQLYELNELIYKIMVDEFLLSIIGLYYGCQPYYSQMPCITVTYPTCDSDAHECEAHFPRLWHYDLPNQMTAHILLTQVSSTGTRMRFARSTHKTYRTYVLGTFDYNYSTRYVTDRYDIVDCVGPVGTLIILDPNTLHRAELVANSFRSHLHLNLSPGNDMVPIATARRKIGNVPSLRQFPHYKPEILTPLQLQALEYLDKSRG